MPKRPFEGPAPNDFTVSDVRTWEPQIRKGSAEVVMLKTMLEGQFPSPTRWVKGINTKEAREALNNWIDTMAKAPELWHNEHMVLTGHKALWDLRACTACRGQRKVYANMMKAFVEKTTDDPFLATLVKQSFSNTFSSDKGCHLCGEPGHFKRNCPQAGKSTQPPGFRVGVPGKK